MEDNKKDELSELSLNFEALAKEDDVSKDDTANTEATEYESETEESSDHDVPETSESKVKKSKKTRPKAQKKERIPKAPKPPRQPRTPPVPIEEPALPLLVCAVVFVISLFVLITNKFIYRFSSELLAPAIVCVIALVIPTYLAIMLNSPDKSLGAQLKEIGCRAIRAEHVFFMIFAALFTMCASLALTLLLGGATDAARGITLFGAFTAGVNEYTVSTLYLVLSYVILPAVAEEILFRGLLISRLEKISFPFAALVSCTVSALFGFSLGGLIPALFVSAMMVFVLYTTNSLVACMIVHALVNLYKLFLEANVSAYFISSRDNFLLLITVAIALAISSLLFFSEGAKIFRERSQLIAEKKAKSARKSRGIKKVFHDTRAMLAYTPSLVFAVMCGTCFVSAVVINFLTR